jgi:hypothetical protein
MDKQSNLSKFAKMEGIIEDALDDHEKELDEEIKEYIFIIIK